MSKPELVYKVGSAFRITTRYSAGPDRTLELDRRALQDLSEDLSNLLAGEITITALPDCPALCVYSERRWDVLRDQIARLPNQNPEARRVQRLMLGHATPYQAQERLVIDGPMVEYPGLSAEMILVVFNSENAELWTEAQLAKIAGSDSDQGQG